MQVDIGERILSERKKRNMSQTSLGDQIGRSLHTIREWETNIRSPRFTDVCAMSDAFGMSLKDFIFGTEGTYEG